MPHMLRPHHVRHPREKKGGGGVGGRRRAKWYGLAGLIDYACEEGNKWRESERERKERERELITI